jgi:hypothetical protein
VIDVGGAPAAIPSADRPTWPDIGLPDLKWKLSKSFVHAEINRGRLKAFRFGGRLWRIKGRAAKQWVDDLVAAGSDQSAKARGGKRTFVH